MSLFWTDQSTHSPNLLYYIHFTNRVSDRDSFTRYVWPIRIVGTVVMRTILWSDAGSTVPFTNPLMLGLQSLRRPSDSPHLPRPSAEPDPVEPRPVDLRGPLDGSTARTRSQPLLRRPKGSSSKAPTPDRSCTVNCTIRTRLSGCGRHSICVPLNSFLHDLLR